MRFVSVFMTAVCTVVSSAFAAVIQVPSDYPTIQAAIDAASNGDEIVVAPGLYSEHISFSGKAIVLRSSDGPDVTTISAPSDGSVVLIISGEGDGTTLRGFTIRDGNANGGGVNATGGGIRIDNGGRATIEDCVVVDNSSGFTGGGVMVHDDAVATIRNSVIESNDSNYGGGGYLWNTVVEDCVLRSNHAAINGGGLEVRGSSSLARCMVDGNTSVNGGGIFADGGTVIQDSLFVNNSGGPKGQGGAVSFAAAAPKRLTNVTITNNTAETAAAVYGEGGTTTMHNCVIWDNDGTDGLDGPGTFVVTYSAIQGGYAGTGNIDADPRFVDPINGDYNLGIDSPCIDAGDNDAVLPDTSIDLAGSPRFVDVPFVPDTGSGVAPIVDMGAFESQASSIILLDVSATCPGGGLITISWSGATPNGRAALIFSRETGDLIVPPGFPCQGTQLGLGFEQTQVAFLGPSDANGERFLEAFAGDGACGGFVQVLDLSTCEVSNVAVIE